MFNAKTWRCYDQVGTWYVSGVLFFFLLTAVVLVSAACLFQMSRVSILMIVSSIFCNCFGAHVERRRARHPIRRRETGRRSRARCTLGNERLMSKTKSFEACNRFVALSFCVRWLSARVSVTPRSFFFVSRFFFFFSFFRKGYDVGDLPDNSRDLMESILNDPEAR